ncbi:DUF6265 family protein [Novosphingobium kaempferiae]|uniref:DUF6265 family protein n=1 Tax=Novosphingobium kaempferiae TaxID=2896849 RepID=UPI001E4A594C|nr:DUF6265 family protein [Novosphingobium kaempferiae]
MAGVLVLAAAAVVSAPALPDWMAGCWISETATEWTEECWTPARGGVMLGTNRSGKVAEPAKTANWEMMQIGPVGKADGNIAFRASLRGSPWTAFERTASEGEGITFLNTAHDYPQRIRYWREGETLHAEIALADGSQTFGWTFRKVR